MDKLIKIIHSVSINIHSYLSYLSKTRFIYVYQNEYNIIINFINYNKTNLDIVNSATNHEVKDTQMIIKIVYKLIRIYNNILYIKEKLLIYDVTKHSDIDSRSIDDMKVIQSSLI